MKRVRLTNKSTYFKDEDRQLFVPSGCKMLDCVLGGAGGGWAQAKIINIVGDKSTAKTGLVIEAFANFEILYPKGEMFLQEAEAAFLRPYARSIGFPDRVDMLPFAQTVEEAHTNLTNICKGKHPKLLAIDSLDALSDKKEMNREVGDTGWNTGKSIEMSAMFRKLRGLLNQTNTTLIIISQVRDKINVTFGNKQSRSGGRALDFYAAQVLWLTEIGKRMKQVKGIKRPVGINIRAKCTKNKVARPHRECDFPYIFEYGIEDLIAAEDFLKKTKVKIPRHYSDNQVLDLAVATWAEIEESFTPKRSKYPRV